MLLLLLLQHPRGVFLTMGPTLLILMTMARTSSSQEDSISLVSDLPPADTRLSPGAVNKTSRDSRRGKGTYLRGARLRDNPRQLFRSNQLSHLIFLSHTVLSLFQIITFPVGIKTNSQTDTFNIPPIDWQMND